MALPKIPKSQYRVYLLLLMFYEKVMKRLIALMVVLRYDSKCQQPFLELIENMLGRSVLSQYFT